MNGVFDRERRVPVRYAATLTTSDGREHQVYVTDVSASGFRLEGRGDLVPNAQVYLNVGKQGNVAAEIRWVIGDSAGGVFFDEPKAL